jgi:hypothetical protein
VISFFYWSIKHWFHTEGKLAAVLIKPSSWGFPTGPLRHQWVMTFYGGGALIHLKRIYNF